MSETTPGFDRKNAWLYKNVVAGMVLANLAIVIQIVLGNPPGFVTRPALAGAMYLMSALVSVAALVGLWKSGIRGVYPLCASVLAFVVAGAVSGYPQKVLWVLGVLCVTTLVFCIVMGDKADQNTKEKTIRFKLPW
jgi:hypothetical protein